MCGERIQDQQEYLPLKLNMPGHWPERERDISTGEGLTKRKGKRKKTYWGNFLTTRLRNSQR